MQNQYHEPNHNCQVPFVPPKPSRTGSELIEAIRQENRIEDVAGEYTQLRRSGSQLTGRCPLHSERTSSFYVHPGKQVFRCHGCLAGGDVFALIRALHNCSFPEAKKILAARAGVELNGYKPSPELVAKVAALKAQREEEVAFEKWFHERTWAITNAYRHTGVAALHAEDYLRSVRAFDPVLDDMAWGALQKYIDFTNAIEREGLLDLTILREEWITLRRGARHVN
jgi:hypothetical protein